MMHKILFVIILLGIIPNAIAQSLKGKATNDYISFYQQVLSNQKNSRCAMYPSCSAYGKMVFNEKPFIEAITLLTDRIIRCSHEQHFYDITYQYGYRSCIDFPYYKTIPLNIIPQENTPHTDNLKMHHYNDSILPFINHLINKEDYQNALLEIERSTFYKPDFNHNLYGLKLLCYRGLSNYEKGIFEYEVEFPDTIKKIDNVNFQAALLYYNTSNYNNAIDKLNKITHKKDSTELWQKAYLLNGIIKTQQKKYNEATTLFQQASFLHIKKEQYENNLIILKNIQEQKRKSPTLARILSIIPGGGYLYTNHKGSALTAFIVNSLLGYATYTSIRSKNYGMAGVCGFLGLSFYIGNINGAGRSAIRYNEKQYKSYIKRLENNNHIFIN